MNRKLYAGVAFAALMIPGAAYAQSTGSIEFEKGDIVVTGTRVQEVGGTKIPDSGKTKVELTNKFLSHQVSGQSVDEMINQLPGVSFTNNDPYGSSGGNLTIRGFDSSRILQTIDGTPINDTGNYAIYSNQQIDPELIDQVNVSLGSVDIDSPSASASGSTVNYTTITPTDEIGARLLGSVGDLNFFRVFGLFNTGVFTPWGTKAWFSASHAENDVVFANRGKIRKGAYNFKVYQPIGSNGDFVAIAGNYNVNRNNNTNDIFLDDFPTSKHDRTTIVPRCQLDTPEAGVPDKPNSCGTSYLESMNPSNTGSLRLTSSFHLADNLILTVDPTFQYVKANGGLSAGPAKEGAFSADTDGDGIGDTNLYGYINNGYYFGRDLNGDGDTLDTVEVYHPSQTVTHRYTLTSSLLWNITDTQAIRIAYAHDYGRHRQSGQVGYLLANGQAKDPFPINEPITAVNGAVVNKRDRKSFAILDKVGVEYRGTFFDNLRVDVGGSYVMMKRNLHQYCFTSSNRGFVDCVAGDDADFAAYQASHPGSTAPVDKSLTYNKFLPAANVTYDFGGAFHAYASYSKGIQVPGTDNLYQALFYAGTNQFVNPVPETTDNFDAGLRYTTSKIQMQVGPWLTIFNNRLASSYDPITDTTTYRNLGTVHKYGIDGSIAYQPMPILSLYAYASYLKSEIMDDVQTGQQPDGTPIYAPTKGKRESGAPVYTVGGRVQLNLDPVEIGVQAKHTGKTYVNDLNVPITIGGNQVYPAATPEYTVVDLDARVNLAWAGLNDKTYVQFNVTNLFDEMYPGGFGGTLSTSSAPFIYIGPPRTFSATLNVAF
ncbi:MAG TPA: TonB-dependent receptor [Sphingomonas sp.]|nr:TonB-dependent receptor [Sphingomonas sp.]